MTTNERSSAFEATESADPSKNLGYAYVSSACDQMTSNMWYRSFTDQATSDINIVQINAL